MFIWKMLPQRYIILLQPNKKKLLLYRLGNQSTTCLGMPSGRQVSNS